MVMGSYGRPHDETQTTRGTFMDKCQHNSPLLRNSEAEPRQPMADQVETGAPQDHLMEEVPSQIDSATEAGLLESESETPLTQESKPENIGIEVPEELTGSAKSKYVWLIRKGVNPEKALKRAKIPSQYNPKRPRQSGTTPPEGAKKQRREDSDPSSEAETEEQAPKSFSAVLKGIRVGIVHAEYPKETLDDSHMDCIQERLFDIIAVGGDFQPRFYDKAARPGWMVLTCADEETATWIRQVVPQELSLKSGIKLSIVEEKDFPRSNIVVAHLPRSSEDSSNKLLKMIGSQNHDLSVKDWRLMKRTNTGSMAILTVSVDNPSAERLKANNKIFFKWSMVPLKLKDSKQPERREEQSAIQKAEGESEPEGSRLSSGEEKPPLPGPSKTTEKPQQKPKVRLETRPNSRGRNTSSRRDCSPQKETRGRREERGKGRPSPNSGRPSKGERPFYLQSYRKGSKRDNRYQSQ